MKKEKDIKQIVIFQAKSGAIELRGDISRETIWATQAQIKDALTTIGTTKKSILVGWPGSLKEWFK